MTSKRRCIFSPILLLIAKIHLHIFFLVFQEHFVCEQRHAHLFMIIANVCQNEIKIPVTDPL